MENKAIYDVAIVGAGASGLTCALQCARGGKQVVLLEKSAQPGRKILVSGNGRCNLTNAFVSAADYRGTPQLAGAVLQQFPFDKCVQFFHELGVLTTQEYTGRVFPLSGKSTAVSETLRLACEESGVKLCVNSEVTSLQKQNLFTLTLQDGTNLQAKKCVLACGSCAYPQAGGTTAGYRLAHSLGHTILTPVQTLCALKVKEKAVSRLQGIRAQVRVTAWRGTAQEVQSSGEVLFTPYGLSGPAVLNISGPVVRALSDGPVKVELDMLPEISDKKTFLSKRIDCFGNRIPKAFFAGMLHDNIINLLLDFAGLRKHIPVREWTENTLQTVANILEAWPFTVLSARPWQEAMVAAGGVKGPEINYNTMESRYCPGLYVVGELLDVDGRSGGFNLHFAWGSGYVAARAITEE